VQALRLGLAFGVAAVIAAACVSINESMTGRDLECEGTPEDVCIRVADLGEKLLASGMEESYPGREFIIIVYQADCPVGGTPRGAARCWDVEFSTKTNEGGTGMTLFELPDGRIVTSGFPGD
jgi:hypothetical protein